MTLQNCYVTLKKHKIKKSLDTDFGSENKVEIEHLSFLKQVKKQEQSRETVVCWISARVRFFLQGRFPIHTFTFMVCEVNQDQKKKKTPPRSPLKILHQLRKAREAAEECKTHTQLLFILKYLEKWRLSNSIANYLE